jgi:hypothetical protein
MRVGVSRRMRGCFEDVNMNPDKSESGSKSGPLSLLERGIADSDADPDTDCEFRLSKLCAEPFVRFDAPEFYVFRGCFAAPALPNGCDSSIFLAPTLWYPFKGFT